MGRPSGRAQAALLLCLAALARGAAASSAAAASCASCKSLLGALQRRTLSGGARELLRGACAARPEAQAGPCRDAAAALEEQIVAALAANPPAALCGKAGACSTSFMADLAGLLFEAPPARGELCASCEAAMQCAAAALSDGTTQRTLRASAHGACASLRAPLAAQCASAVEDSFPSAVDAALTWLAQPRAACVALEQCACPMHAALDAAREERFLGGLASSASPGGGASALAPLLLLSSSDDYEDWWHQLWTSTTSSEAFAAFSEIFWSDSSTFVTTSEDGEAAGVRFESVAFMHPRAHGPL